MREEAVLFGEKKSLVGILTDPNAGRSDVGDVALILLNAGILHRVGPGRIYVNIARELAARGFTTFRFDFSGIGDSRPRPDNLPFDKSSIDETQSAMDILETKRGIRSFILMGGCSGARVSFNTSCVDSRVSGSILINCPVTADDDVDLKPEANKRKNAHYYLNFAIRNSQSWRNFFTGEVNYRKIFGALAFSLRRRFGPEEAVTSSEWLVFRQNLNAVIKRGVRPVFVCSEGDSGLQELREAGGHEFIDLCSRGETELVVIPRSDHTFSSLFDQERLIKILREKTVEIARRAPLLAPAS
ncbi:MAG TPA: alpha/beta fold hydrolase [Candidatus Acidoferrales bacterium]|nr:alpha/beta fold hydrolase [Candidatus Acidoferrales bacterium]